MKTIYKENNSGVEYYRDGCMHGGGWYSRESGVNPGDMRVINKIVSKAWIVRKKGIFRKNEVHWIPVEPEQLRKVDINEKP